jgi:hypothetical protein
MRLLAGFNPYLTGAVLSGTVGRRADVHLQVQTTRVLEIFLRNQKFHFAPGDAVDRRRAGGV